MCKLSELFGVHFDDLKLDVLNLVLHHDNILLYNNLYNSLVKLGDLMCHEALFAIKLRIQRVPGPTRVFINHKDRWLDLDEEVAIEF